MKIGDKYLRDNMFVINCAARTGSTMLVHMLRSNPKIICHGEVYVGDRVGALTVNYRQKRQDPELDAELHACYQKNPHVFLYKYVFDLQGRLAVGFKFKTDELFDEKYSFVADLLAADSDIKVVHLYREDLVAQYISHQVVLNQTGITLITKPEDRPQLASFELDRDHFRSYVLDVFRREQSSLDFYKRHRGFLISYEDAVMDDREAIEGLQRFIGVPVVELKKGTEKIIDRDLHELVGNLAEVRGMYSDLEKMRPIKNVTRYGL